ncbi:MAG: hypothetical protein RL139_1517 [Gemmatimonadota bacterium]|jgi:hypothetical protein
MGADLTLVDGAADPETAAALVAAPAPASKAAPADASIAPKAEDIADEADDDTPSAPRITIPGGQRDAVKVGKVEWYTGSFEGTWIRVHVNTTRKVFGELASGDDARQDVGLTKTILAHNLTNAETGEPLPTPLTVEALGELPIDLYIAIARGVVEAIQRGAKLPKSG